MGHADNSISPPPDADSAAATSRLALVDVARGLAIAQMVAYHFCYDLQHFAWTHTAMTRDPGWIAWRSAIVTQFLFLVGVSLTLRPAGIADAGAVLTRRWWQIAGCAALVSAGSAVIFGPRWIWFGILQFVVVAQILVAPVRRGAGTNLLLGAGLLALGTQLQLPAFAPDSLSWIGFSPVKPLTEDFVPLVQWIGVVVMGMGAGNIWRSSTSPLALGLRGCKGPRWLAAVGRWPLTIYMVHQPVLFGAFTLLQLARGAGG